MYMKNSLFFTSLFFCSAIYILAVAGCSKQTNLHTPQNPSDAITSTTMGNGICNYDVNESALAAQGYTKVFEDNFTSGLNNWNTWVGGAYNKELEYYQQPNLQITNGNLVITTKKETVTGVRTPYDPHLKTFDYTSGRIESKTYFTPSASAPKVRISARIKLPPGYGMWPAFWTYNDPWPTKGEMDIIESRGQEPFKYTTNYYYGVKPDKPLTKENKTTGYITSDVSLTDCYHVYEVIWTKDTLSYLLDGNVVDIKTGGYVSSLFGKLERITLNVAVGGNYFVNFDPSKIQTGTMYVDWIKVFTAQ